MDHEEHLAARVSKGTISSFIFAALAFLIPFFFIPSAVFPFQFSKVLLTLVAVVLAFAIFAVKALRARAFTFDWSLVSLSFFVLPLTYLLSAVFSSVPALSFMGYQLDQDTFGFMALAGATAFVTTLAIRSEAKILSVLLGLLVGGWVAIVFQTLQVFFGVPISLGLFSSSVQNLVGTWNDFGLLSSLIGSLALLSLETLSLSTARKAILAVTLFAVVVMLALVGSTLAWALLGIVAFSTLIFSFMRPREEGNEGMHRGTRSAASLIALVVVAFFLFFGSGVSASLQNHFAISALDVSPSFQGTLGVMGHVYSKNPIFGSGPNTFGDDWFAARPAATLSTVFWATDFVSGVGYIPTAATTGGLVVALGWLFLIAVFLFVAVRALLSAPATDERSYFLLVATSVGSAFLLVAHFFYDPSPSLTILLFLFLGLFVSSLRSTRFLRTVSVSFAESPRLGFLSVLVLAIALVLSLVSVYRVGETYASAVYAGRASVRANANDLPGALTAINQAIALSPQDTYLRSATQLQLASLNTLVQSGANDQKTQQSFQNGLSLAIAAANQAVAFDPLSYANLMNRASVYEAVVPLGIQGAADNAHTALESARPLNPASPEVDYQEAALKEYAKDHEGAKTLANAAIAKKADYTPAILLLAQIAINEGNLSDAITSLKSALVFNQNDPSLLYELGLLELQNKQYADAATTLQAALDASPDYANAKFFLAGADMFLDKKDDALALLKELQTANPDNATLTSVINDVEAGKNPFAGSNSPLPPETPPASGAPVTGA
jgi:tetratricopeptide (TPR) repeat protein